MMMSSKDLLLELLRIPSPTYREKDKTDFIFQWMSDYLPSFSIERFGNNIIASTNLNHRTRIGFVGHTDTVPDYFEPFEQYGNIHGSGASDMQSGLASMLYFIKANHDALLQRYNLSIVIYDKEEGTPLHDNGLNELINQYEEDLKSIDVAIVGEPTNNAIQLGCVGSLHYTCTVHGKAAHSARPWHGKNALYEALPIIKKISDIEPKKQSVFGVDFYDVISITESQSSPGRTTIPEQWTSNINYRFSPIHTMDQAKSYVTNLFKDLSVRYDLSCLNAVDAGKVIYHPFLDTIGSIVPVEAKQAWTDVAQLTSLGICAFNFGPGRQDQAHLPNEYVTLSDMSAYEQLLYQLLLEEK